MYWLVVSIHPAWYTEVLLGIIMPARLFISQEHRKSHPKHCEKKKALLFHLLLSAMLHSQVSSLQNEERFRRKIGRLQQQNKGIQMDLKMQKCGLRCFKNNLEVGRVWAVWLRLFDRLWAANRGIWVSNMAMGQEHWTPIFDACETWPKLFSASLKHQNALMVLSQLDQRKFSIEITPSGFQ